MKIFRQRYVMFCLLGFLFAAPGVAAYLFYLHPNWLGHTTTNKGRLLNPPVLLTKKSLSAKWQLMLWSKAGCDQSCISELDKLARIRLALGRHLYEVDALLVIGAEAPQIPPSLMHALNEQDIHVLRLSQEALERLSFLKRSRALFIVNPEHYMILAYPPRGKPEDIFHDLKQLLTR